VAEEALDLGFDMIEIATAVNGRVADEQNSIM
jgi:hypothetical protein